MVPGCGLLEQHSGRSALSHSVQGRHLGPLSAGHRCPCTANPNGISFTSHAQIAQFGFSGTLMTLNGQAYGTCASQDRKKDTPLLSGKVVARKG